VEGVKLTPALYMSRLDEVGDEIANKIYLVLICLDRLVYLTGPVGETPTKGSNLSAPTSFTQFIFKSNKHVLLGLPLYNSSEMFIFDAEECIGAVTFSNLSRNER
jgi:hypothetical protein